MSSFAITLSVLFSIKKKNSNVCIFVVCLCSYIIIFVVASMDSTALTGQPSGGDWQEEVYQKVIRYFLITFISSVKLDTTTEVSETSPKLNNED